MPDLLLASVEYGDYISIVKFIIFLVLFFLWLLLVCWVYKDAGLVETNEVRWTGIIFGAGAAAVMVWLVVPLFVLGMLLYLLSVGITSLAYVAHRNGKVLDSERILTIDHIKSLFVNEEKKISSLKNLVFITANNNEVPIPQSKTPEFSGYKIAYDVFTDAIWRRANDILFLPTHQNYNVIYYIDGAALKQPAMTREQIEYFIHYIKNLADLDVKEKRKPQKGKFKIVQGEESTDWTVTTAGSTTGEQILFKQVIQQNITRLSEIGLTAEQYAQLSGINKLKQGLFIVSSPRKNGVTSTFYALIRNHDAFLNSINTLEKQPSAELPNITQTVFSLSDTGTTTYGKRLQTIVRMGPDIVGVADCQDTETAQVACAAAKDGKIVYVVLEADSVMQAFDKWIKLVGNPESAVEPLIGISNQRLLRKLCDECKEAYEPDKELLHKFGITGEKTKILYRPGKVQYDKHGKPRTCENCQGTGFVGRICVFEVIMINDELKAAIKQLKSLPEITKQFRRAKMLYLQEQAMRSVIGGLTAVNEMVRIFSTPKSQDKEKPQSKT